MHGSRHFPFGDNFSNSHNLSIHYVINNIVRRKFMLVTQGGGEHSLNWPRQVCAAEQGMVFKDLRLKQGIQFH